MSRIGKKPISIPDGVTVSVADQTVQVKGPKDELSLTFHPNIAVKVDTDAKLVTVERPNDQRLNRALHGLTRSLVSNMVTGVVTPFERRLEIIGVGYQASVASGKLNLQVGFANTVSLEIPPKVTCELTDPTHIVVRSADKQAVGQFAAVIRRVRPPEPYKGKGIRYQGEHIRRKAGKAMAGG